MRQHPFIATRSRCLAAVALAFMLSAGVGSAAWAADEPDLIFR